MIVSLHASMILATAQMPPRSSENKSTPAKETSPVREKRPLRAEDLMNFESFAGASFSPDGEMLAYLKRLSERDGISADHDSLRDRQRAELWVVPVKGGEPRKIQPTGKEVVGLWRMYWSPDSQRLALESATADGSIGIWIWQRSGGSLRKLVERRVNDDEPGLPTWIDSDRLLYGLDPEGLPPSRGAAGYRGPVDEAKKGWAKGLAGREPAVSALDSGVPQKRPHGLLTVTNVRTGETHELLRGPCWGGTMASATGTHVACLNATDGSPSELGGGFRLGSPAMMALSVSTTDGKRLAGTDLVKDVVPHSIRWSLDGARLAVVGRSRLSADAPARLFVFTPATQTLEPWNLTGIGMTVDWARNFPKMFWTPAGSLLLYAQSGPSARSDWWLVSESQPPRNLTGEMKAVPSTLLPEKGGASFLGVSEGKLWRLAPASGAIDEILSSSGARFNSVIWPVNRTGSPINYNTGSKLIVTAALSGSSPGSTVSSTYLVDLSSGKLDEVKKPTPRAIFYEFSPRQSIATFTTRDENGFGFWIANANAEARPVLQLNKFASEIADPQWKRIEYRGMDGQELTAWVLMPFGYEQGKRYPLITHVYAGLVYGNTPPFDQFLSLLGEEEDGRMLSAHGYAVLFPSMPLPPEGVAHDNYLDMTHGVMPAIDKLIDMGIADPKKLGVMGESYGGYSVYSLITQTKRFQAAVASAGPSDLTSFWGQFDGETRYLDDPQQHHQFAGIEGGQFNMGSPPWKDPERYVRNSPIFYADRVETPVMIIQGDMDFVPIQQGEEFFMAMFRQNKRAKFLRYWTSGHGIGGANGVDKWKEIYAWFDEFLTKP